MRPPVKVAEATISQNEDPDALDFERWSIDVDIADRAFTIARTYRTAGEALDAALKWADDRGLMLSAGLLTVELIRPGHPDG